MNADLVMVANILAASHVVAVALPTPDPAAAATEHLVQATWSLAKATGWLAVISAAAVVVPIIIRLIDRAREQGSAITQLASILYLLEVRVKDLLRDPLLSSGRAAAGTDTLVSRALQMDIAQALDPKAASTIYDATTCAYRGLSDVEALQDDFDRRERMALTRARELKLKVAELNSQRMGVGGNPVLDQALKAEIKAVQDQMALDDVELKVAGATTRHTIEGKLRPAATSLADARALLGDNRTVP